MIEWLLIAVAVGVVMVGLIVALAVRKKKAGGKAEETNYYSFFVMGIAFAGMGIPLTISTNNPGMLGITALGIIYMFIGLSHRDKWGERSKKRIR